MKTQNDTLERLKKIVSSDEYTIHSAVLIKDIAARWEQAAAAENLGEHISIKNLVSDLRDRIKQMEEVLLEQRVITQDEIGIRLKMQAERTAFNEVINLFSGEMMRDVEVEIESVDEKVKTLGD